MRVMQYRFHNSQESRGAKPKDMEVETHNIEIYSTLVSLVSTEVLFYPFETILHRLQLQGTRTIIDNLDSGFSVVPILTSYEGAVDCYRTTVAVEGVSGLYKGKVFTFAAKMNFSLHVSFPEQASALWSCSSPLTWPSSSSPNGLSRK